MTRSCCRTIALLLLTALLAAPWAAAEPPRAPGAGPAGGAPLDLLTRLWGALASLWADNGCSADPNGRCAPAPAAVESDAGCTIDPDGRCAPAPAAVESDNGCTIDPNGHCAPAPAAAESDAGCTIDPSGRCASGS